VTQISIDPLYPTRIQMYLGNIGGPLSSTNPDLGAFDPRRDLEVYMDGSLLTINSFTFDSANNRYLMFADQTINMSGVLQVIHHMPSPPFTGTLLSTGFGTSFGTFGSGL
jgi:hypothetical protein